MMNNTQKKIAVYGGSFNPPHLGHSMIVSWLLWSGIVDKVIILPVYAHAFDGVHDKKLASFNKRVRWCQVVFENCMTSEYANNIIVSELERDLATPSYTIDSLRELQKQYPKADYQLRLVIGSDSIPHLSKWKDWSAIDSAFSPIVVGRVGYDCDAEVFFPDISSTDIREKLKAGIVPEQWIHKKLAQILRKENPYIGEHL